MKKVFYIKAYTKVNLGDDLFIKILCERYPMQDFVLYASPKYKKIYKTCKNLRICSKFYYITNIFGKIAHKLKMVNILKNYIERKIIKKVDAIIIIGGSLFIQNGLSKSRTKVKIEEDKEILKNNKPVFLIGSNFGPYTDEEFYKSYKKLFVKYEDVCFREEASYNLFSDLKNVRFASDVVFGYNCKNNNKKLKNKEIIISVMDFRRKEELKKFANDYEEKIIKIIKYFSDKNFSITLIGFCSLEGDNKAINNILKKYYNKFGRKTKIKGYLYSGNINECMNIIKNSSYMIATRFHSMVLGYVCENNVFSFAYSQKTTNVLKEIGQESNMCEISNINNLKEEEIYNKLMNFNKIHLNIIIDKSKNQFEGIDNYLKGEQYE